jgi:hypothetical protein
VLFWTNILSIDNHVFTRVRRARRRTLWKSLKREMAAVGLMRARSAVLASFYLHASMVNHDLDGWLHPV